MKKSIAFVFALSVVLYLSGMTTYAQGKGPGRNPGATAGQTRTPTGNTKSDERAEHAQTAKADKDKDKKEDREAREAKKEGKFEERIENNPQLKARVQSLLPAGMGLKTAAMGFRNQGEFIAALHVSKNLDIPFDQLKAKVTGEHPMSLGKAIHELRPNLTEKQVKAEEEKAEKQAKETEKPKTKPIT